eukprot:2689891-Pleurochrysis_carterae.AAC.5
MFINGTKSASHDPDREMFKLQLKASVSSQGAAVGSALAGCRAAGLRRLHADTGISQSMLKRVAALSCSP